MTPDLTRPAAERLTIAGPAGDLEALVETPGQRGRGVAVICHPHPVYGGTMTNKVVHVLAKTFNERGVPAVRFNFRGVGASAGAYDEGEGETQDALAVIDWALQRFPGAALWLAGFSFGGAIAVRAAMARDAQRLITVAPAVHRFAVDGAQLPRCPWLLVQGIRMNWSTPAKSNAGWRRSRARRSSRCCRASNISFTVDSMSCAAWCWSG